MKLEEVSTIPTQKKKLQRFLEDFMSSPITKARVIFNEADYKNINSCYSSLHTAIKRSKFRMKLNLIGGVIYLHKEEC